MKRFWKEATTAQVAGGWQVMLDGRAVKTQAGSQQIVPNEALAAALAAEWAAQGETVNPDSLPLRDLADLAIDVIAPVRAGAIAHLLRYGETDTLCYRAEPDEPLHARQLEVWEPLLGAAEARWDVHFERIAGIIHRPQSPATLARLEQVLTAQDNFHPRRTDHPDRAVRIAGDRPYRAGTGCRRLARLALDASAARAPE